MTIQVDNGAAQDAVKYGTVIQLLHVKTGLFLACHKVGSRLVVVVSKMLPKTYLKPNLEPDLRSSTYLCKPNLNPTPNITLDPT